MMPSAAWVGVVITLAIFVIGHLCTTIWWASRVNTLLDRVQTDLRDIITELRSARDVYVNKETLAARIAESDKEHKAMWREIDSIKQT